MPGPPVATNNLTFGWLIIHCVLSIDGSRTIVTKLLGAPAASNALLIICTKMVDTFLALGCGLNTTVLPPTIMEMELLIIVSVGFVVGVMAPITPNGQNSSIVNPS